MTTPTPDTPSPTKESPETVPPPGTDETPILFIGPDGQPWRIRPAPLDPEAVWDLEDALFIVEDSDGVQQGVLTVRELSEAVPENPLQWGVSKTPLFPLGTLQITTGAVEALFQERLMPEALLARHVRGDWGDLDAHDRAVNRSALQHGQRLLSAYTLPRTGQRIWIITDADRAVTTLLLPSEY